MIPIEIIQESGAYFYALPKESVESKYLHNVIMLPVEDDDNMPEISDFYF